MNKTDPLRGCARALAALPSVAAVDVLPDDPRIDGPSIEAVVGPDADRVPPRVCQCLGNHDVGIHTVATRGDPTHFVAVVR